MKLTIILLLASVAAVSAQRSNEAVKMQIRDLKAEKAIALSYDTSSQTSKLSATASNFSSSDAKMASIQAMNFGMAIFYNGTAIVTPNEYINFTFWVMSKKPRYASGSKWTFGVVSSQLDLGSSRYVGKPGENMEYLNFKLKRTDLEAITALASPKFRLGNDTFTFTPDQMRLLKNFLAVTNNR